MDEAFFPLASLVHDSGFPSVVGRPTSYYRSGEVKDSVFTVILMDRFPSTFAGKEQVNRLDSSSNIKTRRGYHVSLTLSLELLILRV